MADKQSTNSVEIINAPSNLMGDLYHQLLRARWGATAAAIIGIFLVTNVFFALLFLAAGGVANARPGSFWDAFFFSVQTLGTIGYGTMYPATTLAHAIVTAESLAALAVSAIATGLVFAKFSMPTARLAFSRQATVFTMDGALTLAFRVANERGNYVVEAQIRVSLVRTERTPEGLAFYKMYDLQLVRDRSPALGRSWTVLHKINQASPLLGATSETLLRDEVEIIVTILGIDGTSGQNIHGRHTYDGADVRFGKRHVDLLTPLPGGRLQLDYAKFHDLTDAS